MRPRRPLVINNRRFNDDRRQAPPRYHEIYNEVPFISQYGSSRRSPVDREGNSITLDIPLDCGGVPNWANADKASI